jgi:pimeloyl-ACP methyl ester carboxylesterase
MRIEIAPNVRLFVDIDGFSLAPDGPSMKDRPTLICMHGGPGFDHSSFKPVFSQLTDVAQVLVYDHRGHGRSDKRPLAELTLDTFADDIVRLCDKLGIEKPIVLGQSFGGFVAQRYIERHPHHASKIILSSTSHSMNMARKLDKFEALGGANARAVAQAFWEDANAQTWQAYWGECRHLYNTTRKDEDAGKRGMLDLSILFHFVNGERKTMSLLGGLKKAACPVLVLAGEQDPICPIEDAREIAAALPKQWMQFRAIANAGHGTWRDQEAEAMAVLRAFIQA